jgi:aryl-alcohol dehydrogenase-like predicted oxidoreductase
MADLVDVGLVRWIGVSNFTSDLIKRCEAIRHVDSLQPQLSMLWHERKPLLDSCRDRGIGVVVYGPLAYGLLTGTIRPDTSFPEDNWRSGTHGLRAYNQLFVPRQVDG